MSLEKKKLSSTLCKGKKDSHPKFVLDIKTGDATHTLKGYEKV